MTRNYEEDSYLDLLYCLTQKLKENKARDDRTGVGCISRFGDQLRFNLAKSFPLLTTKSVYWKGVFYELSWFLRSETNTRYLTDNNVHIWDQWALTEDDLSNHNHHFFGSPGDLGPIYGSMWRNWPGPLNIDQIDNVIKSIKENPNSRRHVISAWNPTFLPDEKKSPQQNVLEGRQALPPCHCLFQFFVENNKLSCQLYQRSADIFLGVPFNIASYSLLTLIIANVCDLEPGEFIHTFGDVHLYSNHLEAAETQLKRSSIEFPKLRIKRKLEIHELEDLDINDFELIGYNPQGGISAPIAV